MRWTSLCLGLALVAPAAAQEWPKPTEAGRKGLDALIRRCVEAGGLKESKDQKTGAATLSLADAAKVILRHFQGERLEAIGSKSLTRNVPQPARES